MGRMVIVFSFLATILWAGNYVPVRLGWLTFDHDTGNCVLTVTATAAIGFPDPSQSQGSGFWYPPWVNQTLYYGSMATGNSKDYVVDAYYGQNGNDWRILEDSLYYHIPPEFGLQEVDCLYDDHGPSNANPKDLECFQYSVADAAPDCDDFVIIEFIFENKGSSAISSLYSAIFVDFDIGNATDNYGKTDSIHRTAYMQNTQSNENPTVGIVYLGSKPQPQLPIANLSVIDPSQHGIWNDSIMYLYMNGTYHYPESNRQYDWSVVISAGPFDLPVGAKQHATFAIVGGLSNTDYLQNCQHAIEQYDTMWPGIEEESSQKIPFDFQITPNPLVDKLTLNFSLANPSLVKVNLFDLSGRRITGILNNNLSAGDHKFTVNLSEKLSSGIYFLILEAEGKCITEKVILRK